MGMSPQALAATFDALYEEGITDPHRPPDEEQRGKGNKGKTLYAFSHAHAVELSRAAELTGDPEQDKVPPGQSPEIPWLTRALDVPGPRFLSGAFVRTLHGPGKKWEEFREAVDFVLSAAEIRKMGPPIHEKMRELLEEVGDGPYDLAEVVGTLTLWAIRYRLGVLDFHVSTRQFFGWLGKLAGASLKEVRGMWWFELRVLWYILRRHGGNAPIDELIRRYGRLKAVDLMATLMVAGAGMSAFSIQNAFISFLARPDFAAFREECLRNGRVPSKVYKDTVNHRPPEPFIVFTVTRETEFAGHQVVPGQRIVSYLVSANRERSKAGDARPLPSLSYGPPGSRHCPGEGLDWVVANEALLVLLEQQPDVQSVEVTGGILSYVHHMIVTPHRSVGSGDNSV